MFYGLKFLIELLPDFCPSTPNEADCYPGLDRTLTSKLPMSEEAYQTMLHLKNHFYWKKMFHFYCYQITDKATFNHYLIRSFITFQLS